MGDYNINGLAIPLFLVFMVVEFALLKLQGKDLHRYNDTVTSLSMGLCLLISDALLKAYTFAVFIYLWEHHRLFDFGSHQLVTWVVFFFAVDVCYYAFHRCAHEINILWGAHVGHHQSEEYNLRTALRQSAFQYAFSWVFYLPLAILGCPPTVFLLLFVLLKMYQFWLHTQGISRIPFIEGIFSTPSSHRVHHAKNPLYIDKNYGGTLVIWDRFFGTWQPELAAEPCHYGTTQPLDTLNPIKANLQHWSLLTKDSFHTASWSDKVGLWFKRTGWRPVDCIENNESSLMQKDGCENREKFNPQASTLTKLYVGMSFIAIVLVAVMFLFLAPTLSAMNLALGSALLVYSLVVINDLLESNKRLAWFEVARVPLLVWFASTLWFTTSTTRNVDTVIMDKSPQQVLNYASNVALWPQWHPQSSKIYIKEARPLLQGDTFEEDILTALGKNHLIWNVVERSENNWVAHAHNQNNGSKITIEYQVKGIEGNTKTEFVRILDYTLPNVLYVAINALYLKPKVELKSQEGVQRLKKAVEVYVP